MAFLKKIIKKNSKKEASVSFKEKLRHFQNLLDSNDEALKLMGSMSDLLMSGLPFSRGEISGIYQNILSNTQKVTHHLSIMCGGKYKTLINQVAKIEDVCNEILAPGSFCPLRWDCPEPDCTKCDKISLGKDETPKPYSYRVDEITMENTREVGGKMSRLCEIHNKLLIPIPDGFSITSRFFIDFLFQNDLYLQIDKAISSIDFNNNEQVQQVSQVIQALIIASPIPQLIEKIILNNYEFLSSKYGDVLISVRSSAVGEDDLHYSFAGLHYTALNVSKENLIDACFEVLISKYLPQSLVYRYLTGLRDVDMPMSIGCMQMIDSEVSGVLFTKDPMGKNNGIIIHAVRGLGTKIVDGSVSPQEFIVDPHTSKVVKFKPGNQTYKTVPRFTDGLHEEKISDELVSKPCLTEEQLKLITEYALRIENHFSTPQDIEWTINKNGEIYILQCRPLAISFPGDYKSEPENVSENIESKYPVLIDEGICASPGINSGKVFLLNRTKDLINFQSGDILVVRKTSPELTRVLHKASGLIADIGNTTGHLAIIARELGIPVIVNTSCATKTLTNGMTVTIDANQNKIYNGVAKELIESYKSIPAEKNIFIKSPMHRIWQNITKQIIPLNLSDPGSQDFTQENCKTLHDVTRFAHEYAMREMFLLYESAQFEDKHAYPLKFSVPLDIHVIDLGNGLKNAGSKKHITPENIISKPFLSLIKGMTAPGIRWAGPLPIDLKGFTNLLMSNVVDSNRSDRDLGSRSYAIISDRYVNFFSRLGYHFSRLDAYASEELNNNYINFNFRGGAADSIRRMRRAKIVTKVLETLNFSVSHKNDHVLATIRKIPASSIFSLLTEIGRLMGAVRNVDVTLTSDESIDKFVDAFLKGDSAPVLRFMEDKEE
jgi:pyruvate, water dikinase